MTAPAADPTGAIRSLAESLHKALDRAEQAEAALSEGLRAALERIIRTLDSNYLQDSNEAWLATRAADVVAIARAALAAPATPPLTVERLVAALRIGLEDSPDAQWATEDIRYDNLATVMLAELEKDQG